MSGYLLLFASALLAATIFPAQSEALLLGLLASKKYSAALLLLVASAGNILGSWLNYLLGLGLMRFQNRRWFPIRAQTLARAQAQYQRYGYWSLLLSWAPIIGDPLTVVAGVLREPLWRFLLLVSIAKTGRYLVVYGLSVAWF